MAKLLPRVYKMLSSPEFAFGNTNDFALNDICLERVCSFSLVFGSILQVQAARCVSQKAMVYSAAVAISPKVPDWSARSLCRRPLFQSFCLLAPRRTQHLHCPTGESRQAASPSGENCCQPCSKRRAAVCMHTLMKKHKPKQSATTGTKKMKTVYIPFISA